MPVALRPKITGMKLKEAVVSDEFKPTEIKATEIKPQHSTTPKKGGGAGKWLIGAAVAAVLAGGGYLAWKNYSAPQTQTADAGYAQSESESVLRAAPLPSSNAPVANPASAAESNTAPAAPRARRAATTPEETIGVTPASYTASDGDDIIVPAPHRPVWTRTPSTRRLAAMYPANMLEREREGEARLSCIVGEEGRLDCSRVSETSRGFGAAAVRVAHSFRHAMTLPNGQSAIGTPVNLRVVFRIDDRDARRRA